MEYQIRAEKIEVRISELALFSEHETGITRTFGTPAFMEGAKKLVSWFKEAGLQTRIDNIGNVRGRLLSKMPDAKTLVIASHMDTVVNAGMYDGPLGVLMGLNIIEYLVETKAQLPFNIELIAFCDEEGVRYHTTYLGSKVVAGNFDNELLNTKDEEGIELKEAIKTIGGDPALLKEDALPAGEWIGYFEIHIEQGPVLYESEVPVAVVSAIAGQRRASLMFTGEAGHAGTVPMNMRYDALSCAAECVLAIERYAKTHDNVLATVGKLDIIGEASNVIPGSVICSLDLRSPDEDDLEQAWSNINASVKEISLKRNITGYVHLIQQSNPVKCDYHLNFLLKRAITAAGFSIKELMSGAGHDAVPVSEIAPVALLFVRCFKGISHNPLEKVEIKDIAAAVKVADHFLQNLINYHKQE